MAGARRGEPSPPPHARGAGTRPHIHPPWSSVRNAGRRPRGSHPAFLTRVLRQRARAVGTRAAGNRGSLSVRRVGTRRSGRYPCLVERCVAQSLFVGAEATLRTGLGRFLRAPFIFAFSLVAHVRPPIRKPLKPPNKTPFKPPKLEGPAASALVGPGQISARLALPQYTGFLNVAQSSARRMAIVHAIVLLRSEPFTALGYRSVCLTLPGFYQVVVH